MLALFAAAAARSVTAPGRPEVILFDQAAESGTLPTGLLAGQQGQAGPEAYQRAAEESQRKAVEAMKDQIDAVAKAEENVDALTDANTASPVLSETQTAQHKAEEAQRQAEEAMQDQIDAVAKAEDGVNALTDSDTSSPVLSETQQAQKDLEQAQAEREAAQDQLEADQDARVAKEKARLEAEEKARLEAEEESKAARAAVAPPPTGLSDDAIEQRKLEQDQMDAAKAALEDAAKGEAQKAADMKGAADADADEATSDAMAQSPSDATKVADAAEAQRKLEQGQMDAAKAALEDAAKANDQKKTDMDMDMDMDGAADADEASREAAAAAAELGIDSYPSEQEAGDGRESAQHDAEEAQRKAEEAMDDSMSSTGLTDAEQKDLEQAQMDEAQAQLQKAARAAEIAAADQKVIESGMMGAAAAAADAAAAKNQHDRAAELGYQEADDYNPLDHTQEQEGDTQEQGSGSGAQEEQGSGDTEGQEGEGKVVEWARNLFYNAKPSNSLAKAGLMIHCFDESEEPPGLFKPCVTGWCANQHFDKWWSASIINSKQPNTFGDSGLLLSPAKNLVNCSFVDDVGTMRTGCHTGNDTRFRNGIGKFDRGELKKMMERSMNPELLLGYNEVLVDSAKFMQRMPRSIAAVIFGLKGDDAFGRVQATQVYVSILDEFGLSETNHIRLIQVSYDRFERMYNTTKDANWNFTDVSEGAREFLKTHPYAEHRREWLKQHPTIAKHPEMAREYLARENRRQELQDALRQDSRSRVALVPPTPSTLDVGGHGPKWIARETAAAQAVADEADEGHIDG